MALKIKIKTEYDNLVHIDMLANTYTLCGLETAGDEGIGIETGVRTNEKINCEDCIRIINICKSVKSNEIKS